MSYSQQYEHQRESEAIDEPGIPIHSAVRLMQRLKTKPKYDPVWAAKFKEKCKELDEKLKQEGKI